MNRLLKALSLIAVITFFASCHKDDDKITPPRDYAVQYAAEKITIEEYLHTHYITVDANYDVVVDTLINTSHTSIWEQTEYPLMHKNVTLNKVDYTLYYIKFRQGGGDAPTRGDNIVAAYRGFLLNNTQFDYNPFPQSASPLYGENGAGTIEGWQQIIPLFNAGTQVAEEPGNPNPPAFENYGAGMMFLPSDFGYYNASQNAIPAYSPLVFSIKLYKTVYTDFDRDGILNRYENILDPVTYQTAINPANGLPYDVMDYDTDADEIPNFLDTDDDGDGFPTLLEVTVPGKTPTEYFPFDEIPFCTNGTIKRHLDPLCH